MLNTCVTCKKTYKLDPSNAVIFLYGDRTYMDNVVMCCDNGHEEILFFYEPQARDKFLRDHEELGIVRDMHPMQSVVKAYCTIFDITLLKEVELGPRQLKMLAELAEVLKKTPDDLLMEVFSSPPPKSKLPRRWL